MVLLLYGIITMAHFGIAHLQKPLTFEAIILSTTFPDIMMLFCKFYIGKAIFDLNRMQALDAPLAGKFIRYPNMGWW